MTPQHIDNFYSRAFLLNHSEKILDFYTPRVIDPQGGYFQNYFDDGEIFDPTYKQLVSSTRIIVNFARASQVFNKPNYADIALHGLHFLEQAHWHEETQSYAWTIRNQQAEDMTQQAYGYAFVLLAYAAIQKAGLKEVTSNIDAVFQLLERRFWQQDYGLYADELSVDDLLSDYRGQNANMHICEAMISAYEATNDEKYLNRAYLIAQNITQRQAALSDGLIWEHYTTHFDIDWEYNKHDPKNLYRPWGFQPGHQTEWSKLLLALHQHIEEPELLKRAKTLFERAFSLSWDHQYGGLVYGFDSDGKWCDDDKYFWVQAESFAAAAILFSETDNHEFLSAYLQLWQYSWTNMVDHKYGAWFRVLSRENIAYSNEKSSAGAKCDYHTLGACFDVLAHMPPIAEGL